MLVLRPNLNSVCCFKSFILPNTKKRISLKKVSPAEAEAVSPTFLRLVFVCFTASWLQFAVKATHLSVRSSLGVFFVCLF